jgi:PhnB protein
VDAGAQVKMPLADMFWGDRMASLVDRWGNRWTLAQRTKDLTPDDMKRASEAAAAEWKQAKK